MDIFPDLTIAGGGGLPGLSYSFKWTPTWFTQSQKAANGASIDISLASAPIDVFEMTYTVLRDFPSTYSLVNYEFRRLQGFYNSVRGSAGRFLFVNPSDNQITATRIGVGDGSTHTFTLTRAFADVSFYSPANNPGEPVGLIGGTINVYLNGVLQGSGFTINTSIPGANTITFTSAPGSGVIITVDYLTTGGAPGYWYYCKFQEDGLQFEEFANGYWSISSVKIQSCRAGA